MLKQKSAFLQRMEAAGVCDERGVAICVTAVTLPGGETGMCLLGLQGNVLSVYDTDMTARVGECLYSVLLAGVTDLKTCDSLLTESLRGYSLRFVYRGQIYAFRNCYQHREALAAIRREAA